MTLDPALSGRVARWRRQDPDPTTVAELDDLTERAAAGDADAAAELADAFRERLSFGTAGLRGAMGPGPNRMNRVVVSHAAAGLAAYLHDSGSGGGRALVGFDARHRSDVFAHDTAEILAASGFDVLLTGAPVPTPVVAFGIRHLGCVAAVMVTASHNPARDNGYKVYLGDGCQIVAPVDAAIAARIEEAARTPASSLPRTRGVTVVGAELREAYLSRVAALVPAEAPRTLSWVYTPLHGVGGDVVRAVAERAGFPPMRAVGSQAEADPDFPTVAFPNPEEPGALHLALREAAASGADLVVANDPDADRCAAAVEVDGSWRMLSGDELGVLLGDDLLRKGRHGTYACSVVSSSLLKAMTAAHGQRFVSTLTGFKWLGRVAGLVFGYEEALGYCVDPEAVADKDGISALLRVLALAAELKAAGSSLTGRLDEIAAAYGVYQTDQLSFRVAEAGLIADAMARLRAAAPTRLAGEDVVTTDLVAGVEGLPPTNAVRLAGASVTVVVRPSGTEPKLKCYLEARVPPGGGRTVAASRQHARQLLARLRGEMAAALGLG